MRLIRCLLICWLIIRKKCLINKGVVSTMGVLNSSNIFIFSILLLLTFRTHILFFSSSFSDSQLMAKKESWQFFFLSMWRCYLLVRGVLVRRILGVSCCVMNEFHHVLSLCQKIKQLGVLRFAFSNCLFFGEELFKFVIGLLGEDVVYFLLTQAEGAQ